MRVSQFTKMKIDDSNAVSAYVIAKTIKYKGRLSSNEVANSVQH